MKFPTFALAAVLALSSGATFAKGDGFDRSQEFNKRFRESQKQLKEKRQQAELQLNASKAAAKPPTEKK